MTGTDLCVNKPQSVPVIFEPPCTLNTVTVTVCKNDHDVWPAAQKRLLQEPIRDRGSTVGKVLCYKS